MSVRSVILSAVALSVAAIPCAGQAPAAAPAPASPAAAQSTVTPEQARLLKSAEAFVRHFFGWGADLKVALGPLGPAP